MTAIASACLLIGIAAAGLWPATDELWEQSTVWMECRTTYAFAGADGDTLFCASLSAPMFDIEEARQAGRAGQSRMQTAVFVSADGCLIAPASAHTLPPADSLRRLLECERERLSRLHEVMDGQLRELDYYERTHSTADDGYTEVMTFRTELQRKHRMLDSLRKNLEHVHPVPTVRHAFRICLSSDSLSAAEAPGMECRQLTAATDGLALFGTDTHTLPEGRCHAGLPLWTPSPEGLCRLWAFCSHNAPDRSHLPRRAVPVRLTVTAGRPECRMPRSADGAPVTRWGQWAGVLLQDTCVEAATLRSIVHDYRPWWKEVVLSLKCRWKQLTAGLRKEDRA